ncbi:MAG: CPBP family intramembrane glutamic endopeptidase [Dokdonella sp.]
MKTDDAKVSLCHQLNTAAVFCVLAVAIILLFHAKPYSSAFTVGLPLGVQLLIGAAFAAAYWIASRFGSRLIANRKAAQHIAESYSRLDLSGWNPLWIAVAAGVGEELLFRGALQPIVGIWVASILFVLVHIRAYRWDQLNKRVLLQSFSVLAIGVSLGLIAMYVGLFAAVIVHAAMDAVGLYAIRLMTSASVTATG